MKLKTALRLGRVSNLPTVWTNVLVGAALGGASWASWGDWGRVVLVLLAMSAAYVGGMFLNDAYDAEIDDLERPERPIPSGEVGVATVFRAGYALLALSVGLVALACGKVVAPAVGLSVFLTLCVVLYDRRHKDVRWSPLVMAACRVSVYGVAALALGGGETSGHGLPVVGACAFLHVVGLTYVARQENLRRFEGAWPLVCLAVPVVVLFSAWLRGQLAFWVMGGYAMWVVTSLLPLRRKEELGGAAIGKTVTSLIAAIALMDACFLMIADAKLALWIAQAAFMLTLQWQRRVPGT